MADDVEVAQKCAVSLLNLVIREDGPVLRRFIQSRTWDPAEIDDVLQDVYIRVLQRCDLVERSICRRAYLFGVARNLLHDRARQRLASARAMGDFRVMAEVGAQQEGRRFSSPQEEALRARQGSKAAGRAMDRLKEKHREIYCLSRMEGLRNSEIASRLGVSLRSVERHVSEVSFYMRETLASYI